MMAAQVAAELKMVPLPPTGRRLSGIVIQQLLNTTANNPVTIYLLMSQRRKHGRRESLLG